MTEVHLYRGDERGLSFRPSPNGRPVARILIPDEAIVDPARDRVYIGPSGSPTGEFRAAGAYLSARTGMVGFRLLETGITHSGFKPLPSRTASP
jgi:hypothetical protein